MVAFPMGCPVGVAGASDVVVAVRLGDEAVDVGASERLAADAVDARLSLLAALPAHPVAATVMTARARTIPDAR
jgi:hypothetical protein